MNIDKLLNNTEIAPYYFAEHGKKLTRKTARVNFQVLINNNAINEEVLKIAKIAYLSDLQKEINKYLILQIKAVKEKLSESVSDNSEELPVWMKNEILHRLELYENNEIELVDYEDFKEEFLS